MAHGISSKVRRFALPSLIAVVLMVLTSFHGAASGLDMTITIDALPMDFYLLGGMTQFHIVGVEEPTTIYLEINNNNEPTPLTVNGVPKGQLSTSMDDLVILHIIGSTTISFNPSMGTYVHIEKMVNQLQIFPPRRIIGELYPGFGARSGMEIDIGHEFVTPRLTTRIDGISSQELDYLAFVTGKISNIGKFNSDSTIELKGGVDKFELLGPAGTSFSIDINDVFSEYQNQMSYSVGYVNLTATSLGDPDVSKKMNTETIIATDLFVSSTDISFSDNQPISGNDVTVTAQVYSCWASVDSVDVRFYDGMPSSGVQIGSDQTISLVTDPESTCRKGYANIDWHAMPGVHDIYFVVDPENEIIELNKEDNIAFAEIEVLFPYRVQKSDGTPLSNVPSYVFSETAQYLGINGVSNEQGNILFSLVSGNYKIASDYLGTRYFSDVINIPQTESYILNIDHRDVTVSVKGKYLEQTVPIVNIPVYLFSSVSSYLNELQYTDIDGAVRFNVPVESFKFRADYLNKNYWSSATQADNILIEIPLGNITLTLKNAETLTGIPVYVFDSTVQYTGIYGYSDANGQIQFTLPEAQYKFRADASSHQYFSGTLTVVKDVNTEADLEVGGGLIVVRAISQTGAPIANIPLYAFSDQNQYLGKYSFTDQTGSVTFDLPSGNYLFRADFLGYNFFSEPVSSPGSIDIIIRSYNLEIAITDGNTPLTGIPVYLFKDDSYLGLSCYTDFTGKCSMSVTDRTYHFRYDYMNNQYWSTPFTLMTDTTMSITIQHQMVNVHCEEKFLEQSLPIPNSYVYLFSPGDDYLGRFGTTNEAGVVSFYLPMQPYKFRLDHLGRSYWSTLVVWQDAMITVNDGKVNVQVTDNGNPQASAPVYLFSSGGQYLSVVKFTDTSGNVNFTLPENDYKFRADFNNEFHWSAITTVPRDAIIEVIITESSRSLSRSTDFTLYLKKDETTPIPNMIIYIYHYEDNSYTGISGQTDQQGMVQFSLSDGTYFFRVEYLGYSFYSNVISIPNDLSLNWIIPHKLVNVNYHSEYYTSYAGCPVSAFSSPTNYIGLSGYLSSSNSVSFYLPEKAYNFRLDYLGLNIWSGETIWQDLDTTIGEGVIRVSVLRGEQPISNVPVYVFDSNQNYLNKNGFTSLVGVSEFILPIQSYRFRTDVLGSQFTSDVIIPLIHNVNNIGIQTGGGTLRLNVKFQDGQPLQNIPVYVFSASGQYLNLYSYTNEFGNADFDLSMGVYNIRADYLGNSYWLNGLLMPVEVNGIYTSDLIIEHQYQNVYALGSASGFTEGPWTVPLMNVPIYVFTSDGQFINIFATTNEYGLVTFLLPANPFKFRLDYLGNSYWSDEIVPDGLTDTTITIEMNYIAVSFFDEYLDSSGQDERIPIQNAPIYVFDGDDYLGIVQNTDNYGYSYFLLPIREFRVRADFNNRQYWSQDFIVNPLSFSQVDISIASDLAISVADIDIPSTLLQGDEIDISATVHSLGSFSANEVYVKFYIDSKANQIGETQIDIVPSGIATATISWQVPFSKGIHTILVEVDPLNVISETSENNNIATASVMIRAAYDVELVSITPLREYITPEGNSYGQYLVEVRNDGYYADTFQLSLSEPAKPWRAILNEPYLTLASCESATVLITVYPDTDGDSINDYDESITEVIAGYYYLEKVISTTDDAKISDIDFGGNVERMAIQTNLTLPSEVNYEIVGLEDFVTFSLSSDINPIGIISNVQVEYQTTYKNASIMNIEVRYKCDVLATGEYALHALLNNDVFNIISGYSVKIQDVTLYGKGLNWQEKDTDLDGLSDKQEMDLHLSPINPDTDNDGIWDRAEIDYWQAQGYNYEESAILALISDKDQDQLMDGAELGTYFTNPDNPDTDLDQIEDGLEVYTYGTDPTKPDTDSDGMPDHWEISNGFAPTNSMDAGLDPDNDALFNVLEYQHGTDPLVADTDGEGLNDGDELGLGESDNIPNLFITNPLNSDTDNDGLPDGWEVLNNFDPTNSQDALLDQDQDGLNAIDEMRYKTNPWVPDIDFDGLFDGIEVALGTDPNKIDTDDDGLPDIVETALGSKTDATKSDTDNDGLPDGWIDFNHNGIKDLGEFEDRDLDGIVDAGPWANGNGPGETDPSVADSDNDGMPDGWEINHNLDPLFDDSQLNPDNDGLINVLEYKHNSDPNNQDTDGDGILDGAEVHGHPQTDPSNPDTDGDGLWDGMNVLSPVFPFNVLHYGEGNYGTDSTKADTDGDKLTDYNEVMNYFHHERIETEDLAPMVTDPKTTWINQFDVKMSVNKFGLPATSIALLSSTNSPETMIRADQTKSYQIAMSGGGNVLVAGIPMNLNRDIVHQAMATVLENAANFVVYSPGQPPVPINPSATPLKVSHLTYNNDDPTEYPFVPSSPSQEQNDASYHWIQKYQYDLTAGNNYPVEINMNYNGLNGLYKQTVDNLLQCVPNVNCPSEGWLVWVNISIDFFYVEKLGLDPLNDDCDQDSLLDGWEYENNTFPYNADPDMDGISDPRELQLNTNPEDRDTDHDGLRDSIEIGNSGQDVDPYTSYDSDARNIDSDTSTTTDPLNPDSDNDNVPDGWIDGWGTDHVPGEDWTFSKNAGKTDMVKQRSEGEDLNCNGEADSGDWSTGAGETDPNLADTDGDKMPDSFEVHYFDSDGILDPLVDDASDDADNDGRTNLEEYLVDTHPKMSDTDKDGLGDSTETEVRFRTNVPEGALRVVNYGSLNAKNEYEWVWFVNPEGNGAEYGYYGYETDPQASSFGGYGGNNPVQYTLFDDSKIIYNKAEKKIYIWIPGSDYLDKNDDGVLFGSVHIFAESAAQDPGLAETSSDPKVAFKDQELYIADPFSKDTDEDGMPDNLESLLNIDSDGDGLINIRDTDSDNDGIPDGQEVPLSAYNSDLDVDRDGIPNMLDMDSDNDRVPDSVEYTLPWNPDGDPFPNWLDWDSDNDGLPDGWVKASIHGYAGTFPDYTNQLIQIGNGDDVRDQVEGEDLDCDGIQDPGETNMTESDTDGDGLTDGYNYVDDYGNQQIGELTAGIETDPTNPDCDNDGLLDGQEVLGWTIIVEDVTQIITTKQVTSDPWKADTDDDGMPDLLEYQFTDPKEPDTDHDGLSDIVEDRNQNGNLDAGETNPLDPDSDNDHLTDSIELDASDGFVTNPLNWDTDGDRLPDGWVDFNGNSQMDYGEFEDFDLDGNWDHGTDLVRDETNPTKGYADSDFDGFNDKIEIQIYVDVVDNSGLDRHDADGDGADNWVDQDSDGDGIPDSLEILPTSDYDLDGLPAVLDSDSNNDNRDDLHHIYVNIRTNAKDTNNDGQFEFTVGTWVAINRNFNPNDIDASRSGSLSYYTYSCTQCENKPNDFGQLTKSMDGSIIYWKSGDNSKVYVKLSDNTYVKYTLNANVPSGVPLSINPILSYGLANQERWGGENPASTDPDTDHDGLPDDREDELGTNKTNGDTDSDGIPDGYEVYAQSGHTDPNKIDYDSDYSYYGLPVNTAGDGVQDGTEIGLTEGVLGTEQSLGLLLIETSGTDLNKFIPDADPTTKTNPNKIDTDGDGLPDGWIDGWTYDYARQEWGYDSSKVDDKMQSWEGEDFPLPDMTYGNGKFDKDRTDSIHETDPTKADTDGDGLPDGLEAFYHGNPNDQTDADKDPDHDGLILREEIAAGTFADNWDSDGDGLPDGWEFEYGYNPRLADSSYDRDYDGLTGLEEYQVGMPANWNNAVDGVWWLGSNASNPDTDEDGAPDGFEYHVDDAAYNDADKDSLLNIFDTDSDNDGVIDGIEYNGWDISYVDNLNQEVYKHVTSNPFVVDTDSDGLTDDLELKYGTDPNSYDTDGDRNPLCQGPDFGDYWETVNGMDPLFAENDKPKFDSKPEIAWTNYGEISVKFKASDNVGILEVIVKIYDKENKIADQRVDYPVDCAKTVDESFVLTIINPSTVMNGFIVEITVIDINYNVNTETRTGGVIQDVQRGIGKFLGRFSPELAGEITGYYEGFLQSAWDMTFGMIPWDMLFSSMDKQETQIDNAQTMVEEKTKNLGYEPQPSESGCVSEDWYTALGCSIQQELKEKSDRANPFDKDTEAWNHFRFERAYKISYVVGYVVFFVISLFYGGGEARAAEGGAKAAVDAGKAAAKAGRRAEESGITRMTEITGKAERGFDVGTDVERGAAGFSDVKSSSRIMKNPKFKEVPREEKIEMASFIEKNPEFKRDFPGHADDAMKVGCKQCRLGPVKGVGKLMDDGVALEDVNRIIESARAAGREPELQKSLELIGNNPASWTSNSFEDLVKIARRYPEGKSNTWVNIEKLAARGDNRVSSIVDNLGSCIKDDPVLDDLLRAQRDGYRAELEVAANEIPKIKGEEFINVNERVGPSQIDSLSRGPTHYIDNEVKYGKNYQSGLKNKFNIWDQAHPDHQKRLWVKPEYVQGAQEYCNRNFHYRYPIDVRGITGEL